MKKEKRYVPRCAWCGRFVKPFTPNVRYEYTPDSDRSVESSHYEHITCYINPPKP